MFNPKNKITSIFFALTAVTLIMGLITFFFYIFDENFLHGLFLFPLSLVFAVLTLIYNKKNK
jgi:hypothetical protein